MPPRPSTRIVSGSNLTANPAPIDHLPARPAHLAIGAFSHSLETAFLVAVPFAILGFVLSWLIKEIPLRTTAFVATDRPEQGQSESGGTIGEAGDQSPVSASVPGPG